MARPIVIARNITDPAVDLSLARIGAVDQMIPANGQSDLSTFNAPDEMKADLQLYGYLGDAKVVLNIDGTDLDKDQSLAWMEGRVLAGGKDEEIGDRSGTTLLIREGMNEYVEVNSMDWEVVGSFSFPGTDLHTPSTFKVISSLAKGTAPGQIRLFNLENNQQVALVESSESVEKSITTTATLTNLPLSEAVFEIQAKKGGNGRVRVCFISLR